MYQTINMDSDWRFFRGDLEPSADVSGWGGAKAKAFGFGAASEGFDDSGWREVSIPHDFVLEGDYVRKQESFSGYGNIPAMETIDNRLVTGGSLEGGIGWYRKRFEIPEEFEGKRVYLHFDGIFRDSLVFLNHYDVGRHASGYTSFYYDVTELLHYGGSNLLAVRVDASGREGWWYEGGGIYRHVYLSVAEPVHIKPWGIYISAKPEEENDCKKASVCVESELISRELVGREVLLEIAVLDGEDRVMAAVEEKLRIEAWGERTQRQKLEFENPALWEPENPCLYRLRSRVWQDGSLTETRYTSFGVRKISFDSETGFSLNGKRMKIKGVCCHQDHAGVGIAVPDQIWEYRLKRIREMGANALRCSHNPPAPEVLELCDRMGILVMDETRKLGSSEECVKQLRSMVRRDRNHPCIILWSIGNEETAVQDKEEGGRLAQYLKMEVKKLDPDRPVTMAFCGWNGEYFHDPKVFLPVSEKLDVMGFNYMPEGWEEYHEAMPRQPIIITEASTNSGTRGCYRTEEGSSGYFIFDPKNRGAFEMRDVAERQWKKAAELDFVSGIFLWTGFDYRGEPTPFSYPAVSSRFGIMDTCGFPKDNFFYYQSWWSREKVLHLFPHWNFPDLEGKPVSVFCYSNAEEVELFVNGNSQGRRRMTKNWYLEWENVIYQPGSICAVGYWADQSSKKLELRTGGAPAAVCLIPDREDARYQTGDVALFTVKTVDMFGETAADCDAQISFTIEGDAKLLGTGNGNPGSHEPDQALLRRAFHGLCQLIVQMGESGGTVRLRASAPGMKSGLCELQVL